MIRAHVSGEIFNKGDEDRRLQRTLYPYIVLGFEEGVEHAALQVGGGPVTTALTQARKDFIAQWSFKKAKFVNETTEGMLNDVLTEAVDQGWGEAELGRAIRQMYEDMTVSRAKTVARTETTGAIGYGTHETLVEEGHDAHQWSTVIDGRERESHHEADGQVVAIDEPFKLAGGEGMYPGDPSLPAEEVINCRCAEVSAKLDEERIARLNRRFLRLHGALEQRLVVSLHQFFDHQMNRILSALRP